MSEKDQMYKGYSLYTFHSGTRVWVIEEGRGLVNSFDGPDSDLLIEQAKEWIDAHTQPFVCSVCGGRLVNVRAAIHTVNAQTGEVEIEGMSYNENRLECSKDPSHEIPNLVTDGVRVTEA